MGADNPKKANLPTLQEVFCTCEKCGHEFSSWLRREVSGVPSLVDREGNLIYDLVLCCKFCGTVFHWHTKDRSIQENSKIYQDLFEALESALHAPVERRKNEPTVE